MPTRNRRSRTETREGAPVLDGFAIPAGQAPAVRGGRANAPAPMPGEAAGAEGTRRAAVRAALPEGAAEKLSALRALGLRDEIDDEEAARIAGHAEHDGHVTEGFEEPRNPENLPAVMERAVALTGDGEIVPRWHMVRHLPGYMQQGIRALGRDVFRQFTDIPLEDLQVLATLSNDENEVKAMMAWIVKNGVRDDKAEMDFEGTVPDYTAEVQVWNTQGYGFLLVKDFAGYYVYGWPGGRGVHLDHEPPKMIR